MNPGYRLIRIGPWCVAFNLRDRWWSRIRHVTNPGVWSFVLEDWQRDRWATTWWRVD